MKTERQKVSLTIYIVAFMGGHSEVRCGFGHQPQPHMTSCTSVRFYTRIVELQINCNEQNQVKLSKLVIVNNLYQDQVEHLEMRL